MAAEENVVRGCVRFKTGMRQRCCFNYRRRQTKYDRMINKPSAPAEGQSGPSTASGLSAGGARKPLSPAAQRALAEAEARRAARDQQSPPRPGEIKGPAGPDPVRYGDWEVKGIASDF
jgi:hypothetical protein